MKVGKHQMKVTEVFEVNTYWEVAEMEKGCVCAVFTRKANFSCAFPGPQCVTFVHTMLFYQSYLPPLIKIIRDGGKGYEIISFISVRVYCFVFES
jgi:hypothetical protein